MKLRRTPKGQASRKVVQPVRRYGLYEHGVLWETPKVCALSIWFSSVKKDVAMFLVVGIPMDCAQGCQPSFCTPWDLLGGYFPPLFHTVTEASLITCSRGREAWSPICFVQILLDVRSPGPSSDSRTQLTCICTFRAGAGNGPSSCKRIGGRAGSEHSIRAHHFWTCKWQEKLGSSPGSSAPATCIYFSMQVLMLVGS